MISRLARLINRYVRPYWGLLAIVVVLQTVATIMSLYLPTLNGSSYLAYNHPQEHDALVWIEAHLDRNAVMLEATGNPYSYFGRVATNTGRATVLRWGNHEALWRDPTWKSES